MTSEIALLKARLRQDLRARVRNLTQAQRASASAQGCALLSAQPVWNTARSVLFYAPLPDEIDVSTLMERALEGGKTVTLPRFVQADGAYDVFQITDARRDCARGKFGIAEPSGDCPLFPLNRLDLVLAPGVGFDAVGHRLGRGGGYYDRLLARATGVKCGVAFDEQMVHQIPAEPHDIQMNFLLTPTRWLETTADRRS